ncbi:MAG: hypothetical protein ASUL_07359 [Candidatus Aramenus sulfurataquae]|uniref:Uncharacterized protein n=1 Tax=Candidatus Aramenus sulfurataquae TaxID=1326980 RepID=W7KVW9_9CREN|nr:MAG: hypothetical protein ASUL_07359 [Candidatus Aramenus sulfurataquae]
MNHRGSTAVPALPQGVGLSSLVMFKVREGAVDMEVEVEVPLNFVTSRILRKRVERFAESFNEAVRLYRIEKKI